SRSFSVAVSGSSDSLAVSGGGGVSQGPPHYVGTVSWGHTARTGPIEACPGRVRGFGTRLPARIGLPHPPGAFEASEGLADALGATPDLLAYLALGRGPVLRDVLGDPAIEVRRAERAGILRRRFGRRGGDDGGLADARDVQRDRVPLLRRAHRLARQRE